MKSQLIAEWAVAIGTLLLAVIAFIGIFFGDSYTRLIKSEKALEFKKEAFKFLRISYASWG